MAEPTADALCTSEHWSLPVRCTLPRTHRENWHQGWEPKSGNLTRYRYPGRLTEEYCGGEWRTVVFARPAVADSAVARLRGILARDMSRDAIDQLLTEAQAEMGGVHVLGDDGRTCAAAGRTEGVKQAVAFLEGGCPDTAPDASFALCFCEAASHLRIAFGVLDA